MDYESFLYRKTQHTSDSGFDPVWMPDMLFDFQKYLVEWAVRRGRSAILSDCGTGKSAMQLVWAENVARKTNGRVLILAPLAVGPQTVREGEKFGVEVTHRREGIEGNDRIVVTNYQRLHYFDPSDFVACVADEGSAIKNFQGKTRHAVTAFMRHMKYRLVCTATAAPNDYDELGTLSEALGYLGYSDMLSQFFKQDTKKDYLGWARSKYVFRGHAAEPFWRWVCSWARVCRQPSDMGFDDKGFILPELRESEHIVENSTPRDGMLFSIPAKTLQEQREERRNTLVERCDLTAEIVHAHDGASVVWCHLNDEGKYLTRAIDNAVEVAGSMPDEQKEERLLAFASGEIQRLVIKPKIGAFGLNWQHCHNVVTFASHSFESYYQSVRRCWRFGQKNPVTVAVVATEGERGVLANLKRKSDQADLMFASLSKHANDALIIDRSIEYTQTTEVPSWLE